MRKKILLLGTMVVCTFLMFGCAADNAVKNIVSNVKSEKETEKNVKEDTKEKEQKIVIEDWNIKLDLSDYSVYMGEESFKNRKILYEHQYDVDMDDYYNIVSIHKDFLSADGKTAFSIDEYPKSTFLEKEQTMILYNNNSSDGDKSYINYKLDVKSYSIENTDSSFVVTIKLQDKGKKKTKLQAGGNVIRTYTAEQ